MRSKFNYFFWLLFLAFSLMILVVATQILTKRNINGLKAGNRDAVITFTINNRLQELVNLSFDINSKITGRTKLPEKHNSLLDSLTMLGYNATVLESMSLNTDTDTAFHKLNRFVSILVETSMKMLQNPGATVAADAEYLRKLHISDSIYSTALSIQKSLEKDLQATLSNNNKTSDSLSDYNKTLAIIAIAAVFIFSAIIINRNLTQIQLISELEIATQKARESAQVKDQFLANMSHEIRTPLNAIKGFSRLMALSPLNKEQQQYTSIIYDATNNLVNIVNDILDISKIEAGKLRIEKKDFNIKRVLQAVKQLFKNAAAEKNIELTYEIEEDVPLMLTGDPERLSQILINLVSNGIKFTTKGFVLIKSAVKKKEGNRVWLEFMVQDSGAGIPKDKLDVIFGRFEQLDAGKDLLTKGTGLGLSIVKSLTSLMEGNVSVSSDAGRGATFFVLLPFEKAAEGAEEQAMQIFPEFRPVKKFSGSKVLLVDDNKVNQMLIKYMLEEYDITPEIASNGKEALDILLTKHYDLVLMDIQMPVMDGYSSTKAIRRELKINVPVIAMTAYALPGEKEKCLASGMNGYLAKPVDSAELDAFLSAHLAVVDASATKKKNKGKYLNYLLQLFGGDEEIAGKIIAEIVNEIPVTRKKVKAMLDKKDFSSLGETGHNMISTFSPLGDDTEIIKVVNTIRNAKANDGSYADIEQHLEELLFAIDSLENDLRQDSYS